MTTPFISSLLDNDLYKFTMMQCVFHHCQNTQVKYRFMKRKPITIAPALPLINESISALSTLSFKEDELQYLTTLPFMHHDFIDYLAQYHFNTDLIKITNDDFGLVIEGPWLATILFEVPLLAIISESYYQHYYPNLNDDVAKENLALKAKLLQTTPELKFSDFGTRRRFSKAWQEKMIIYFKANLPTQFIGTSNVYFAKKHGLKPIGTMAHEFLQAYQVLAPDIKGAQAFALEKWLEQYPYDLGIALTDVLTMDVFLQEFNQALSHRYQGLRQDSGDPIQWGEKALAHYQKLGINPKDKCFVFSDGLNAEKALNIYQHFKDHIPCYFGIGTNLTNDMGVPALDIVIKMVETNGKPVIKISDSQGKIVCDDKTYIEKVKNLFNLKEGE